MADGMRLAPSAQLARSAAGLGELPTVDREHAPRCPESGQGTTMSDAKYQVPNFTPELRVRFQREWAQNV